MTDLSDTIEQNKRLAATLVSPPARPRLTSPNVTGRDFSGGGGGGGGEKKDKGILGGIASIIPSAVGAIGRGVGAIPQFVGKLGQTAIGLGEGVIDLGADLINENLYKSRFETDLEKGRELGLEGDALTAYAAQRQYPLAQIIIESTMGTGRRVAEVVTGGAYDYGDPGIDYARAFREGNLGALLVEDIGNVILAGRATGAGNVVSRAGTAIGETAPRLGRAVSTAGRVIEEPVGEAVRQTGRLVGAGAQRAGMTGLSDAARRVYYDIDAQAPTSRPIRVLVNQVGEKYRSINEAAANELFRQAADLSDQAVALRETDPMRSSQLQAEADIALQKAQDKVVGTGVVRAGRKIAYRMALASERSTQRLVNEFRRVDQYGSVPDSVANLRKYADQARKAATKEGVEPARAQQLEATAVEFERRAAIKERYPEYFDQQLQPWVAGAATLLHIGLGRYARYLSERGFSDQDIAIVFQRPDIIPTLEEKGMKVTPEMVKAAREYDAYQRGNMQAMNEGAALAVQGYLELVQAAAEAFSDAVRRGFGIPTGALPSTFFSFFPEPSFLLAAMTEWNPTLQGEAMRVLDYSVAEALYEMYNQGQVTADDLKAMGFDYDTLVGHIEQADPRDPMSNPFRGYYRRAVKAGAGTDAYEVAAIASESAYPILRRIAPEEMMNKNIYPAATTRPAVEAAEQVVRMATADDVATMRDSLIALVNEFQNDMPKQLVEGALRDIDKSFQPGVPVTKTAWLRMRKRIDTILLTAERQKAQLGQRRLATQAELASIAGEIDQAVAVLTSARGFLDNVITQSRMRDLPQELRDAQTAREAVEAKIAETRQEMSDLQAELDAIPKPEPEVAPPSPEIDQLNQDIRRLQMERSQIESEMVDADALEPYDIDNLKMERDFVQEQMTKGRYEVPEPTREQLIEYRQQEADTMLEAAREAEDLFHIMAGGPGLGVGYQGSGAARKVTSFTPFHRWELLSEDFEGPFQQGLQSGGIPLQDITRVYNDFVRAHGTSKGGTGVDEKWNAFTPEAQAGVREDAVPTWQPRRLQFENDSEYIEALGKAYGEWKSREAKAREIRNRKDLTTFVDAWKADQARQFDPLAAEELSGYSVEELNRRIALAEDPEAMSAALDTVIRLEQQITELQARMDDLATQPRPMLERERTPAEVNVLNKIQSARIKLDRQLKELEKAREKEVVRIRRHIKEGGRRAVRARLKGVGYLKEGEPVLRKDIERGLEDRSDQLLNKERNRQNKLAEIKEQEARAEGYATAAEAEATITRQRDEATGPDNPIGPELFDPETDVIGYFPMGPTRGMLPKSEIQTQLLGEGMGAQNEPSFVRIRRGGGFVLTAADTANKFSEIMKQMFHNEAVETVLRDPNITKSAVAELGEGWFALNEEAARQAVLRQEANRLRTPDEIDRAVKTELGVMAIRELRRRGYEPVSPAKIDPETGGHAAVGTLDRVVTPVDMDRNTIIMRIGVKERLSSDYVKKGARNVPSVIEKKLDQIQRGTSRWKSVILPLSLRWQIGDAVSNVMNAWLRGGISPAELQRYVAEVTRRLTDPNDASIANLLFGDLLDQAMRDPVMSALFGSGLEGRGMRLQEVMFTGRNADRILATIADPRARTIAGQYFNQFRAKAFRLNEAHNSIARAAVALKNLEDNLAKVGRTVDEINGVSALKDPVIQKAIEDAVSTTNDILGAFSDLTPWEKSVMRQIFPFWSWVKFINKAAMEIAIDSPDRVLFYAHLGSMASDPDQNGFLDFLRGKTPVGPWLMDLSFMNPYSDAIIFEGNPLSATAEQFTSFSPAITVPVRMLGEAAYGATGREFLFLPVSSRPGYLEGRPGATTRSLGDVLGGMAYIGLRGVGGPFRNVLEVLPTGTIPGTDIATGPGPRFQQGSLRTTGAYAEPRLSGITERVSSVLRTFGIPGPIAEVDIARRQAEEQAQRDEAAKKRREKERANK